MTTPDSLMVRLLDLLWVLEKAVLEGFVLVLYWDYSKGSLLVHELDLKLVQQFQHSKAGLKVCQTTDLGWD